MSTIVPAIMDPARDTVRTTADLGRALRARRRALGMIRGSLAMQMGLSVATVSAIENGKETARVGLVLDLCRDLGLTLVVEGRHARARRLSRRRDRPGRSPDRAHRWQHGFRYLRADLPHPLSQSLPVRDELYGDAPTRAIFDKLLFEIAPGQSRLRWKSGPTASPWAGPWTLHDLGALRRRLGHLARGVLALIPEMRGPRRKRIGDAMGEQARWIAPALDLEVEVPASSLVAINRP